MKPLPTRHKPATNRTTRTLTLVWGRGPDNAVHVRWLDGGDERREVKEQKPPQILTG